MTVRSGHVVVCLALLVATASVAPAQVAPGIDFVTVGAVNNSGYSGPDPTGYMTGRGSVAYEYRIGRTEVTTAQWLDFVNAFTMREDPAVGLEFLPVRWGGRLDNEYDGPGMRWALRTDVDDPGMLPVAGISWREAAQFCNWLHNNRESDVGALGHGAYDTSTWGFIPGVGYTDAPTHEPGARYWIPTVDEWVKAAHFDPDRFGDGRGGYWVFPTSSDTAPNPGPPGEGESSSGYEVVGAREWNIPLGSYEGVLSPWGLLDASGGASEVLEDYLGNEQIDRWYDGASAGNRGILVTDDIRYPGALHPVTAASWLGLRIATVVPTPNAVAGLAIVALCHRRRR